MGSQFSRGKILVKHRASTSGVSSLGVHPQILADQSTLSQPGGQIMPLTLLLTPPNFLTFQHPCLQLQNWLVPTKLYVMHLVGEEIRNTKNWKSNNSKVAATTYTYLTEAEIVD